MLAGLRRESNVERFFVAGILHDVGKLVLYLRAPDEVRQAMEEARSGNLLLHHAERQVMGFDHAHVGEALLDLWNMPASLREAVHFHYYPRRATRFPVETAAVHTADIMANALGLGCGGERFVPPSSPEAWDALGVEAAQPALRRVRVSRADGRENGPGGISPGAVPSSPFSSQAAGRS